MKWSLRFIGICAIMLTISACATTSMTDPEKYNLDGQLEAVSMIDSFSMSGWNRVDMQSFVLQSGSSDFYLVVLNVPSYELSFAESISVNASGSMVRAGNSSVTVYSENGQNTFLIDRMYKFRNAGEIQPIIDQIRGK